MDGLKSRIGIGMMIAVLAAGSGIADAAIVFQDDFEGQSSTWNVGQGALATPAGQSGAWSTWDQATCTQIGADCSGLPSWSNGYLTFIEPTGGKDGTKGIHIVVDDSATGLNDWVGDVVWEAPDGTYTDLYVGSWVKLDPGVGVVGPQMTGWWKIGWYVPLVNSEAFYFNIHEPQMDGTARWVWINNASWACDATDWQTFFNQADFYDGNWHWIEWRIKINSSATTHDGVFQAWLDGVPKSTVNNLRFYCSGGGVSFDKVFFYIGNACAFDNCNGQSSYKNTDWGGIRFDDVRIGTSYVGPPGSGDTTPPAAPSGLGVQ